MTDFDEKPSEKESKKLPAPQKKSNAYDEPFFNQREANYDHPSAPVKPSDAHSMGKPESTGGKAPSWENGGAEPRRAEQPPKKEKPQSAGGKNDSWENDDAKDTRRSEQPSGKGGSASQKDANRGKSSTADPAFRKAPREDRNNKADPRAASGGKTRGQASNQQKNASASGAVDLSIPRSSKPAHKILPYVFLALALFIGVSMILNLVCNMDNKLADDPSQHLMGSFGYGICYVLFGLFGPAAFALPILLLLLGLRWKYFVDHGHAWVEIVVSALFLIVLAVCIHCFNINMLLNYPEEGNPPPILEELNYKLGELMDFGAKMQGGGVIGGKLGYWLFGACNIIGSAIITIFLLAALLFCIVGITPGHLLEMIRNAKHVRSKRAPSYSEQVAEEEAQKMMDEKIRKVTNKEPASGETYHNAPAGAVTVVKPEEAPYPIPNLDPNDGNEVFVPSSVNRKMSEAELAKKTAEEEATKPIDPRKNTDTAVEPIFPKSNEQHQTTKVPRSDRDFDLKKVFIDIDEDGASFSSPAHKPVPPEVPPKTVPQGTQPVRPANGAQPAPARPVNGTQTANTAIPMPPPRTPASNAQSSAPANGAQPAPARPTNGTQTANTAIPMPPPRTPVNGTQSSAPANGAQTAPARPVNGAQPAPAGTKPAPQGANIPLPKPVSPGEQKFGLSDEEFEALEAQQPKLPPKPKRDGETPGTVKDGANAAKDARAAAAGAATGAKPAPDGAKPAEPKPAPVPSAPKEYVFPPISYLQPGEPMTAENMAEIEASKENLLETLRSFRVGVRDIAYTCGPTVTRYEVVPAAGIRVKTILNLSDDIALALRSPGGVRMEAPIPGTSAVGIEIPNHTRSTIYLRNLIESKEFTESKSKTTACLGAGITGEPVIFDIAKMPHLLVAGTTGSGKSVCINCIIMSILYKARPDEIKLVLIDPKKVEFGVYKNIPHLMAPVVTAPKDAAGALQAAVEEMERRFELFESISVRDIKGYNAATKDDPDMPFMPNIVIIIDELADLMMTAKEEVETAIVRIAQKARAAGMHLIIGTQRPSVDVVTGLIKANVPSCIAFAVKGQIDSRVILDHIGAESLAGRGDMLFVPIGAMRDTRVQGAFVDDKEVENICEFIRVTNGTAQYDEHFISKLKELAAQCGNKGKAGGGGGDVVPDGETVKGEDPKYVAALRIAIEEKRVSTSLLQRKLEIGYSRAAKLIDRMQEEGYVSAPDGAKPRSILITPEEFMSKFMDGGNDGGGDGEDA